MELEELDWKTRKLMTMYGVLGHISLKRILIDCNCRDGKNGEV